MTKPILTAILTAMLLGAGGAPAAVGVGSPTLAQSLPSRQAGPEVDVLVRQVLEERLVAGDIPDIGLLRGAKRIAIRSELPKSQLVLGEAALPQRDGYEFRLISTSEATAEAERTKAWVYFIAVDRLERSQETVTMWLGTDFIAPAEPRIMKTCCCERSVQYRRVQDRWAFVSWSVGICR